MRISDWSSDVCSSDLSGKTSILRAVTGLQKPLQGTIALDIAPTEIGFLFQDDALLPWRTARQNVSLGLRIRGQDTKYAESSADEWRARLGLHGPGERFPRQPSSGQRKREALAQVRSLNPRRGRMAELRTEERRGGTEGGSTRKSRRWLEH